MAEILETFDILIDFDSLEESSGIVYGAIHIRLNGRDFPESGWNDMPVAILSDWLAVASLFGRKNVECFFYDGNFFIEIHKNGNIRILRDDQVCGEWLVNDMLFLSKKIKLAARELLGACEAQGLAGGYDLPKLRARLHGF